MAIFDAVRLVDERGEEGGSAVREVGDVTLSVIEVEDL